MDYTSAKAIGSALDTGGFACAFWVPRPAAFGPKESGSCTHGATTVTVSTFASSGEMKAMLQAFGPSASGSSIQGLEWLVVTPDNPAQATAVQKKILGGTIQ